MSYRALGIYREPEFSPGKVDDDARILDAALAELAREGVQIAAIRAADFAANSAEPADLLLAMCQGERALRRLAEAEQDGAVAINSALAIRNCYRDLLASGLARSGAPAPRGALVPTSVPLDLRALDGVDPALAVYVKRGDLHALGPDDVQRVVGRAHLEATLVSFARRGIKLAYVQQEEEGRVVKFYGVSGGAYFTALLDDEIPEGAMNRLAEAASRAAATLGLETWGGDAVLSGERFAIIDFNDWPSYSRVREQAARAIARRAMALLTRPR
jgi:hypothetical protein